MSGIHMLFFTVPGGVDILGGTIDHSVLDPADASCTYSLTSAGAEQRTPGSSNTWLLGGSAADYDVRATVVSGSVSTGTTGSWLNLAATQTWTRTRNISGIASVELLIEIRRVSDLVVIDSATVIMNAEVTV